MLEGSHTQTKEQTTGRTSRMTMKLPLVAPLMAAFLALAPAAAQGEESLLSGYGGPGGGEQVVLGQKLLPPTNGDGGLRARGSGAAQAQSPLTAAPGGQASELNQASRQDSAGGGDGTRSGRAQPAGGGRSGAGGSTAGQGLPSISLPPLPSAGLPPRASEPGSGLPLTARDLALLGLAATMLPLAALAVRRLARSEGVDALG